MIASAGTVLLVRPDRADRQEPADGQPPHQGARRRRSHHRREGRPLGQLDRRSRTPRSAPWRPDPVRQVRHRPIDHVSGSSSSRSSSNLTTSPSSGAGIGRRDSEVAPADLARRRDAGVARSAEREVGDPSELDVEAQRRRRRADRQLARPPPSGRSSPVMAVDRKVIVGRRATSRMSSAWMWASRSGLSVSTEARSMVAVTCDSSRRRRRSRRSASNRVKRPRTVAMPRWRIEKPTAEWARSRSQRPGRRGSGAVVVVGRGGHGPIVTRRRVRRRPGRSWDCGGQAETASRPACCGGGRALRPWHVPAIAAGAAARRPPSACPTPVAAGRLACVARRWRRSPASASTTSCASSRAATATRRSSVVSSLADALRLDPDERLHLKKLAACAGAPEQCPLGSGDVDEVPAT